MSTTMTKYFVELRGEPADLEDLPVWFPDGAAYIAAENGHYYLHASDFSAYESPQEVLERAEELLDEMYAVGLLLWPSLCRVTVEAIVEIDGDGKKRRYLVATQHETVRAKDWGDAEVNGASQLRKGPSEAQRLLAASRLGKHIQLAMLVWSDPLRTWPRLYRILEEIEAELAGSVSKLGFCSDNERRSFTQSANTASVAGKDSRHGEGKFDPPKKEMSLEEATSFMHVLLCKTLKAIEARSP